MVAFMHRAALMNLQQSYGYIYNATMSAYKKIYIYKIKMLNVWLHGGFRNIMLPSDTVFPRKTGRSLVMTHVGSMGGNHRKGRGCHESTPCIRSCPVDPNTSARNSKEMPPHAVAGSSRVRAPLTPVECLTPERLGSAYYAHTQTAVEVGTP